MISSSKPRLLVLTSSFPRDAEDGTCGYIRQFAEAMSAQFIVTVLAPGDKNASDWGHSLFALVRSGSGGVGSFGTFNASSDLNDVLLRGVYSKAMIAPPVLSFAAKALRLAAKSDVICSHWLAPAGLAGAFCSKLLGKPHIVVEHSGALHLLMRKRYGCEVARFVTRNSKAVVVVSRDLRDKLVELCPDAVEKTSVVPMGLCCESERETRADYYHAGLSLAEPTQKVWEPEQRARESILFIGRLKAIKGVETLIRAVASLSGVRLTIAGKGDREQQLRSLAENLNVNADFRGQVGPDQRKRLYSAAGAVVIPSIVLPDRRTEGTPRVCLEAMAAGVPVVASRCGGIPDLIRDGENGLLFEPGDHRMLAEKLELLKRNRELGARLADAGRETAAGFDWSIIGPRFLGLIQG